MLSILCTVLAAAPVDLPVPFTEPIVATGKLPAALTEELEVRSSARASIRVIALTPHIGVSAAGQSREPWSVLGGEALKLRISRATTEAAKFPEWKLIIAPGDFRFDATHIYSFPPLDKPFQDARRAIPALSRIPTNRRTTVSSPTNAVLVSEIFARKPERLLAWVAVAEPVESGADVPAVDEPVFFLGFDLEGEGRRALVLRANEVVSRIKLAKPYVITDELTFTKPAAPAFPKATTAENPDTGMQLHSPPKFLEKKDEPRVQKFAAHFETAKDCVTKQWAKLDPDGRAGRYDLVTWTKNGPKVEGYGDVLARKVEANCKLKPLYVEYEALAARSAAENQKVLDDAVARVRAALSE